jgi:mRNA-degrading endonuclease RelE of RelBE toxin-antitoxin system
MSFKIIPSVEFLKKAKRLSKKYPSFKLDLKKFTATLEGEPRQGVEISPNVYKIRIAIKSKGRGKSGGARVITFVETEVVEVGKVVAVHLVTVYDKSDTTNVSKNYVEQVIKVIQSRKEEE